MKTNWSIGVLGFWSDGVQRSLVVQYSITPVHHHRIAL